MNPNNPLPPMPDTPPPQPVVSPPMPISPAPVQPMPVAAPIPAPQMQDTTVSMNETQTSANSMPPLMPVLPTTPVSPEQIVAPTKKGGGFVKFFLFLVVVLILVAGGVGGFIYYTNLNKLSQSPDITAEVSENTEEVSLDTLPVLDNEIAGSPETTSFQDTEYGFSIDYLSSWDFECISCEEVPESTESAWTILQMKTFDFAVDEDEKIVAGAQLTITARSTKNGADTIAEIISKKTGYTKATYNGIEGALNLDPSQPFQGFIYTDSVTGLDIHLEWKSLSNRDRADKELQTILKSFKKI